jgi:agmatinase
MCGAIFGVPGVTPYSSVGPYCADAPAAIRDAVAEDASIVSHVDFDCGQPMFAAHPTVADAGNLPFDSADFARNRDRVRAAVETILAQGAVPIALGGDDSLPQPMLEAFGGRGPLTILQIDAHIDWRDDVDGERNGLSSGMRRASEMDHVVGIVQVGMRGLGSARPQEVSDAQAWGVQIVPARAVAQSGIAPVIDLIPKGSDVFVALDADALDPSLVPGLIARGPGGLGYWDVVGLIEGAATRGRLVGFEVAEFMPARDIDGIGALTIARIVANVVRVVADQEASHDA